MRRGLPRNFGFAAVISVVAIGCAGSSEPPADSVDPHQAAPAYPYTESNGAMVCGERTIPGLRGEPTTDKEWYPIATMNRHLQNAGTADGVEHVTVEFRDALRDEGIDHIQSCDDAREYVRLNNEMMAAKRTLAPAQPPPLAATQDGFESPVVDKILNGASYDNPPTVGVWIDPTKWHKFCTGQLIGPNALLTSAHCMPSWATPQAFIEIQVWIATWPNAATCISPGSGQCMVSGTGTANVFVQPHPKYDGTVNYDQAVVITNPNWASPANTSSRWTAFPYDTGAVANALLTGSTFRLAGYGAGASSSSDGSQIGYGRRGNVSQSINDSSGNSFAIWRKTSSTPTACEGDSGSGVHTTLGGTLPFSLGIFSGTPNFDDGYCMKVNESMNYSVPDGQWVQNLVNYFGGHCTKQTGMFPYVKCW